MVSWLLPFFVTISRFHRNFARPVCCNNFSFMARFTHFWFKFLQKILAKTADLYHAVNRNRYCRWCHVPLLSFSIHLETETNKVNRPAIDSQSLCSRALNLLLSDMWKSLHVDRLVLLHEWCNQRPRPSSSFFYFNFFNFSSSVLPRGTGDKPGKTRGEMCENHGVSNR